MPLTSLRPSVEDAVIKNPSVSQFSKTQLPHESYCAIRLNFTGLKRGKASLTNALNEVPRTHNELGYHVCEGLSTLASTVVFLVHVLDFPFQGGALLVVGRLRLHARNSLLQQVLSQHRVVNELL